MADIHCGGPLAKTALWYTESTMFLCNKFNIYIYINYIQYYNVTLSTTRWLYFPIALVDFHILSQRFPRTSHLFCFPRGWRHGPVARKTPCSASEILLLGVSRTPSRCSGANFLPQNSAVQISQFVNILTWVMVFNNISQCLMKPTRLLWLTTLTCSNWMNHEISSRTVQITTQGIQLDSMGFHAAFHGNFVDENHISIVVLS